MPSNSIDAYQQLTDFAKPLKDLGYTDLAHFVGVAQASPDALAVYLGTTAKELNGRLALVMPELPAGHVLAQAGPPETFPLGARLDGIEPPPAGILTAPAMAAALPSSVDLSCEMREIRNQGQRGTCVAHAVGAVAEHFYKTKENLDFSRQFIYWDCKRKDDHPNEEGTWIRVAMKCLFDSGCCLEETWKYVDVSQPGDVGQGPPPDGAVTAALARKISVSKQLPPTALTEIKTQLADKRCVAFSVPVFNSWYQNREVIRTGDIVNPIPGENNVGAHAMCFVGYEDDPDNHATGGGRFLLRNSWGSTWAWDRAPEKQGYGTIPYSYINACCLEAYAIESII